MQFLIRGAARAVLAVLQARMGAETRQLGIEWKPGTRHDIRMPSRGRESENCGAPSQPDFHLLHRELSCVLDDDARARGAASTRSRCTVRAGNPAAPQIGQDRLECIKIPHTVCAVSDPLHSSRCEASVSPDAFARDRYANGLMHWRTTTPLRFWHNPRRWQHD